MSLAKYYSLMLSNSRLLRSQSIKQLTAAWSAHKTADLKKVFFFIYDLFFWTKNLFINKHRKR